MGGEWFLKARAGGGCAAGVSPKCREQANAYNASKWRRLPKSFAEPQNKSGAVCDRCNAILLREAAAAAPKKAAPKRSHRSPYTLRQKVPSARKRAKPRSEVDVLMGDSYQLGPGRFSDPVNWDGRKRPRDEGATA